VRKVFVEMSLIARSRWLEHVPGVRTLGVDVARGGEDSTVFALFYGNKQLPFETYQGKDLMKTANRIEERYNEGWKCIAIDDTGIGGGVTDRLSELGIEIKEVQSCTPLLRMVSAISSRKEVAAAQNRDKQKTPPW
jgi:hypothetical protein